MGFVWEEESASVEEILGGMRARGRSTKQLETSAWRPSSFQSEGVCVRDRSRKQSKIYAWRPSEFQLMLFHLQIFKLSKYLKDEKGEMVG